MALTVYVFYKTIVMFSTKDDVSFFGYSIGVVATDSMEDTIMVGDFIIYKNVKYEKLNVEDIVVFNYIGSNSSLRGKKIVHRIYIDNEDGTFITKGDKYSQDPDPLTSDNYIGKVVYYTPLFGLGRLRVSNLSLFFGVIVLGFSVLVIFELRNVTKNYKEVAKKEREEKEAKLKEELKEELKKELENKEEE